MLVIVRRRLIEVYVNGTAVCDPITLDRDVTPALLFFPCLPPPGGLGKGEEVRVEVDRVTLWPAEDIPSLEGRGAVAR